MAAAKGTHLVTIEFRCPTCGRKLKTGEDKAGLAAQCPQCGTAVTVPEASTVPPEEGLAPPGSVGEASPAPQAVPSAGQVVCPMCGAANDAAAPRCYACGEDLFGRAVVGRIPPRGFRDVWRAAWDKWTENFGLNVAATLIAAVMWVAAYVGFVVVMVVFGAGFAAANANAEETFLMVTVVGATYLALFVVYALLLTGLAAFALEQTRTYEPGFGPIFRAAGKLGPALLGTFVTSLGLTVAMLPGIAVYMGGFFMIQNQNMMGMLLAFVGYGVMLLGWGAGWTFFWPVHYLIADRPGAWLSPVADGVRLATANLKLSLLMGLTHAGLLVAGFLTCYIGLLFTMPLSFLLFAVAYDRCERAARAEAPTGNAG